MTRPSERPPLQEKQRKTLVTISARKQMDARDLVRACCKESRLSHLHCLPGLLQSFGRNGRVAGRDPQGSPPLLNKSSGTDESLLHLCTGTKKMNGREIFAYGGLVISNAMRCVCVCLLLHFSHLPVVKMMTSLPPCENGFVAQNDFVGSLKDISNSVG